MRRDVFQAIADPNRRAIIDILAAKKMTLNSIAENFEISRPAISKHIKILYECGIIRITPDGRERICEVNLKKLAEASHWLDQYNSAWSGKAEGHVDGSKSEKKGKKKKKKKGKK